MAELGLMNSELISLLCASAYAVWTSNLIGGPPISHSRFEWLKNPKPGDLVLETSSVCRGVDSHRIGYLLSVGQEPIHNDEDWEKVKSEYDGEPRPTEKVWRIRLLEDGREFHWRNASFIRVTTSNTQFWEIGRALSASGGAKP